MYCTTALDATWALVSLIIRRKFISSMLKVGTSLSRYYSPKHGEPLDEEKADYRFLDVLEEEGDRR